MCAGVHTLTLPPPHTSSAIHENKKKKIPLRPPYRAKNRVIRSFSQKSKKYFFGAADCLSQYFSILGATGNQAFLDSNIFYFFFGGFRVRTVLLYNLDPAPVVDDDDNAICRQILVLLLGIAPFPLLPSLPPTVNANGLFSNVQFVKNIVKRNLLNVNSPFAKVRTRCFSLPV